MVSNWPLLLKTMSGAEGSQVHPNHVQVLKQSCGVFWGNQHRFIQIWSLFLSIVHHSLQVAIRVRPVLPHEKPVATCISFMPDGRSLQVTHQPHSEQKSGHFVPGQSRRPVGTARSFTYDAVMDPKTTQVPPYCIGL